MKNVHQVTNTIKAVQVSVQPPMQHVQPSKSCLPVTSNNSRSHRSLFKYSVFTHSSLNQNHNNLRFIQHKSPIKTMIDPSMISAFILITVIIIIIIIILWITKTPQNLFTKVRYTTLPTHDAKYHFVIGAQLLAKSRSTKDRKSSVKLAKSAAEEADKAISLDPNDATIHVLKALALEAQGFSTSALEALNVALSPLTAKSLSEAERGEALFKRAEITKGTVCGRVDSVCEDLVESVKLYGDNALAFRLLGECYEMKGMRDEAVGAYERAVKIDPGYVTARDALNRLGSTDCVAPAAKTADPTQ